MALKITLSVLILTCGCYVSYSERREVGPLADSGVAGDAIVDSTRSTSDAEPDVMDALAPVRFESFESDEGASLEGYPGTITFDSGLVASATPWRSEGPFALVVRCPEVGWGFECDEVTVPDGLGYFVWDAIWIAPMMLTLPVDVHTVRTHIAASYARGYETTFEVLDESGRILESAVISLATPEGWATSAIEFSRSEGDIRTVQITPADGVLLIDAVEW